MTRPDGIHSLPFREAVDLAAGLLQEHWQEVARNKDLMVLSPAVDTYLELEAAGVLFVLTAWQGGQMVGYSANFVHPHLHYSALRYCQNDVLYVTPAHRASRMGLRLIQATEEEAVARGAQLMLWHAKPDTALESLLRRRAYDVQDVIFTRRLG